MYCSRAILGWLAALLLLSLGVVCAAPIHDAARAGNVARMRALLDRDPSAPNARDSAGATPLHWAAGRGQADAARLLLKRGADTDARNNGGVTALHVAAALGRVQIIRLLLEGGANAEVVDSKGRTPLTVAQECGQLGAVEALRATALGIEGRVTDATGRPLADATVTLSPGDLAVETGTGGDFHFEGLEPGDYSVEASAPGRLSQTRNGVSVGTGEGATLEIALAPSTATLAGMVKDAEGKPVAGAAVRIEPGGQSAVTTSKGTFTLSGLPPGTYTVKAASAGTRPMIRPGVILQAGQTVPLDLTLQPSLGVLFGRALGWAARLLLLASIVAAVALLLARGLGLLKTRASVPPEAPQTPGFPDGEEE